MTTISEQAPQPRMLLLIAGLLVVSTLLFVAGVAVERGWGMPIGTPAVNMNILKQCTDSLVGKIGITIFAAALALIVCGFGPGLMAGAVPILMIAACPVPCLLPLAFLRRARQPQQPGTPQPGIGQEGQP